MAISHLPPEIVTNIFSRLPIKTLSNVILVNKFCLRLISSSDFARAHLKQGKTNLSRYRFVFAGSSDGILKQMSVAPLLCEFGSINVVDLDYPENDLCTQDVCLMGFCDGLVCAVSNKKHIFLWNPCTGKYKNLPPCLDVDYEDKRLRITYGFGYDERADDYKVVVLCTFRRNVLSKEWASYEVYVFSLKRNSWRKILHDLSYNIPDYCTGMLISGKVHWLSGRGNMGLTVKIVSFDVGSEVFGIVELPGDDEIAGFFQTTFDVLEECICLLTRFEYEQEVDLWVMKEYGVKESWTKIFTFSCVNIPFSFRFRAIVLPNDEILFPYQDSFTIYNLNDNSFRSVDGLRGRVDGMEAEMYVQSLVSPLV